MKKYFAIVLTMIITFTMVACDFESDFAEFQGTWVYKASIYEEHIRIDGEQVYQSIKSNASNDEWQVGLGLIEENGNVYIYFSGGNREKLSVSSDGTKLTYGGRTYFKKGF